LSVRTPDLVDRNFAAERPNLLWSISVHLSFPKIISPCRTSNLGTAHASNGRVVASGSVMTGLISGAMRASCHASCSCADHASSQIFQPNCCERERDAADTRRPSHPIEDLTQDRRPDQTAFVK
jgi:hypothetical protein